MRMGRQTEGLDCLCLWWDYWEESVGVRNGLRCEGCRSGVVGCCAHLTRSVVWEQTSAKSSLSCWRPWQ